MLSTVILIISKVRQFDVSSWGGKHVRIKHRAASAKVGLDLLISLLEEPGPVANAANKHPRVNEVKFVGVSPRVLEVIYE